MIGHPKYSGPIRALTLAEPRTNGRKKLPNKANFVQPTGNQWFTASFQYGGTASSARPNGSLQRDARKALP